MNLSVVIGNWVAVSKGQPAGSTDPFFRFMSLWIAFNAFFTHKYGVELTDRAKVDVFKIDGLATDRHRTLVAEDEEYFRAVSVLAEHGVENMKSGRRVQIPDPNDFPSVIDAVYTVRCNLFHGAKLTDDLRDQNLVTASYRILISLSEIILR